MSVTLIGKHEKDARASRDAIVTALEEMMDADPSVCYVDCDLMGCLNTKGLWKKHSDRALQAGIAEANAAGVCAGLAATGKKVFLHSFGTFSSRRCYDQIYMSAAYAGLTVHVLGSDAGVTAAFNGGTHMPLEDAGMYMSIPNATVIDACDYDQLYSVMYGLIHTEGVTYTRFVRKDVTQIYAPGSQFEIGKGVVLHESDNVRARARFDNETDFGVLYGSGTQRDNIFNDDTRQGRYAPRRVQSVADKRRGLHDRRTVPRMAGGGELHKHNCRARCKARDRTCAFQSATNEPRHYNACSRRGREPLAYTARRAYRRYSPYRTRGRLSDVRKRRRILPAEDVQQGA